MKLIPRRKKNQPTTFERVTGFVKLGVKGLAVQRLARKAFRRYKFTKRAVPLAGLAAIGAVVLKKLRGGGASSTPSYSAGASAGAASGQSAATSAAAAATAATGTPPATNGATAGPDVSDALDDAGVEGSGPDTPKEAAAPGVGDESGTTGSGDDSAPPAGEASDDATEASPPADASGTEEGLEIEGPNQSTPPPPKAAKKK